MILREIYSGNRVSDFIRIARVSLKLFHKSFWSFWTQHSLDHVVWLGKCCLLVKLFAERHIVAHSVVCAVVNAMRSVSV